MELSDFDHRCLMLLKESPNKHSRHCFRSAINHLERAEKLFSIDSSMAVFRCITAEEEAATGLMLCLKERGYLNAEKLNTRMHDQKNAVIQFYKILCQFVEDSFRQYGIEIELSIRDENGQARLRLEVQMASNGKQVQLIPEPPLNFAFLHQEKRFSYKKQIDTLMEKSGTRSICLHVKELANLRNKILYANQNGYPSEIEITPKFFPAYQNRVMALIRTYLLIEPYKEPQPFVQDSLDAFLAMLGKLELEDMHNDI